MSFLSTLKNLYELQHTRYKAETVWKVDPLALFAFVPVTAGVSILSSKSSFNNFIPLLRNCSMTVSFKGSLFFSNHPVTLYGTVPERYNIFFCFTYSYIHLWIGCTHQTLYRRLKIGETFQISKFIWQWW